MKGAYEFFVGSHFISFDRFNSKTALIKITLPKKCYFVKKIKRSTDLFTNLVEVEFKAKP